MIQDTILMITLNKKLETLKTEDVYSLLMFLLFKAEEIPEYAVLSRLAYLFDKEVLLTLCEMFGGMTIKFPTIDELENMLGALTVYSRIEIDKEDPDSVLKEVTKKCKTKGTKSGDIIKLYNQLKGIMERYAK